MKRLAWLLVMPYVVSVSSRTACEEYKGADCDKLGCSSIECEKESTEWIHKVDLGHFIQLDCISTDKEPDKCGVYHDLADALNQARERRTKQ